MDALPSARLLWSLPEQATAVTHPDRDVHAAAEAIFGVLVEASAGC